MCVYYLVPRCQPDCGSEVGNNFRFLSHMTGFILKVTFKTGKNHVPEMWDFYFIVIFTNGNGQNAQSK